MAVRYKTFLPNKIYFITFTINSWKNIFISEKLNYIHKNPCQEKWQLAAKPKDYPYSSASNYVLGRGVYAVDIMDF